MHTIEIQEHARKLLDAHGDKAVWEAAQKARELRKERLRLLKELRIVPDRNADGIADADPVKITKLYRA